MGLYCSKQPETTFSSILWKTVAYHLYTMWPGPRPTCMLSFILIHPTLQTGQRDRRDKTERTDNGLIAQGELSYEQSPKNRRNTNTGSGQCDIWWVIHHRIENKYIMALTCVSAKCNPRHHWTSKITETRGIGALQAQVIHSQWVPAKQQHAHKNTSQIKSHNLYSLSQVKQFKL